MQHFTFSIANIALQLREKRYRRCNRHILEHIFFPVLTHRMVRNRCRKITFDKFLLSRVCYKLQNTCSIIIDSLVKFMSLPISWVQHNIAGSLNIILPFDIQRVTLLAISLTNDSNFQRLCIVIERITHLSDRRCHHKPLLHLLWVLAHHLVEFAKDSFIFLG